jgi:hypothetical protein
MLILLLVWLAVGLYLQRERYTAGLPLAYFLGLSLVHVPGAFLYLNSSDLRSMAIWSEQGFEQTVIGMVAFLIGVIAARGFILLRQAKAKNKLPSAPAPQDFAKLNQLAMQYIVIGGGAYFLLLPFLGGVASLTAIIASLGSLILVGLCLRLWIANQSGDQRRYWATIALLPILPLSTLVQGGFLNAGTTWVLTIASFIFAQTKRRLGYILLAPFVIYVGLTVFVDYMGVRRDIRQVVWQEHSFGDRIGVVGDRFAANFDWFDLDNPKHRTAINDRLNQNWLVGLAKQRLQAKEVAYAYGGTIRDMIMGLIPRAIWPDKPLVGGGKDVVSHYTGVKFDRYTSVGAGQVLEFYANFGTLGVIGGFLIWGWLLGTSDFLVIKYLYQGDQPRFLFWFLISLAMIQPSGNLLEIFVGGASAAITAYGFGYLFKRRRYAEPVPSLPPT